MLVKTDAIVLKSMKYRDTSKIVTFYSKEFGKFKCVAKGARLAKNKFGASLDPLTCSHAVVYKKDQRDLHLLSQCDLVQPFNRLREDFDRMSVAFSIIELLNHIVHDEERNVPLYQLLVETLATLNESEKNYFHFLQAFRLRFSTLYGFAPNFESCGKCSKKLKTENGEKKIVFQIDRGAIICAECAAPHGTSGAHFASQNTNAVISVQGLQILRRFATAPMSSLSNLMYAEYIGNEVDETIRSYLRYHFEGLKPLKSIELMQTKK
ncbi:MAG TPA: DNA repair protein RecO [Bacteroidota bacterium]|nr:DNA repair protein RecO [Bacteroidota bacterium]